MAVSNRERVGRAFEVLATGLAPFVDRQIASLHGDRAAAASLSTPARPQRSAAPRPSS